MDESVAEAVWDRARGRCEYCCLPQFLSNFTFEIDHVIAVTHGGKTVLSNLALSCLFRNRHRGTNLAGLDPRTGRLTGLFNPRRQRWPRHFRWEGAILRGRTPAGRTTVKVLQINRPDFVAPREELIAEDLFPPL